MPVICIPLYSVIYILSVAKRHYFVNAYFDNWSKNTKSTGLDFFVSINNISCSICKTNNNESLFLYFSTQISAGEKNKYK